MSNTTVLEEKTQEAEPKINPRDEAFDAQGNQRQSAQEEVLISEDIKDEEIDSEVKERTFKPINMKDLLEMPDKEWLIDQVIGEGDIGMLFGPPGAGKTFMAIDMIASACKGLKWAGQFQTNKPLNIAYCAGEGISGLKSRFEASVKKYNIQPEKLKNFTFFNTIPQLFESEYCGIDEFINEWESSLEKGQSKPIDILFIDTLHTATVGADENSSKDMGKALHLCREASKRLKCAVILIHHTNKAGTGERGSSALRGAMDVMIEIKKTSDSSKISTMECSKLKDGEEWGKQSFRLEPVEGTKSVSVSWIGSANQTENSGSMDNQAKSLIDIMNEYPKKKFNAKDLSEVIGATQPYTIKLLKKMVDQKHCVRVLKDESKPSSNRNPWLYWII